MQGWGLTRFVIALIAVLLGTVLCQTVGERRVTEYPGTCPDDSGWYLVESDQTHVVIGCYDPDYTPPQDPDNQ